MLSAGNGREALGVLDTDEVDVIVSDIRMPELDGMELLMQARRRSPRTQIILMTGYGTVEQAVAAVKGGAFDYVTKPFDPDEMVDVVRKALGVRSFVAQDSVWPGVIGVSPAMKRALSHLETVRQTDITGLFMGESATGMTLLARALHSAGKRSAGRFIAINCGAIPGGVRVGTEHLAVRVIDQRPQRGRPVEALRDLREPVARLDRVHPIVGRRRIRLAFRRDAQEREGRRGPLVREEPDRQPERGPAGDPYDDQDPDPFHLHLLHPNKEMHRRGRTITR